MIDNYILQLCLLRHSAITYPSLMACFCTPPTAPPDVIILANGSFIDKSPEPQRPLGFNKKKFQVDFKAFYQNFKLKKQIFERKQLKLKITRVKSEKN